MVEQRNTYDLKEVLRKTQNGVETEPSTHCPPPKKSPRHQQSEITQKYQTLSLHPASAKPPTPPHQPRSAIAARTRQPPSHHPMSQYPRQTTFLGGLLKARIYCSRSNQYHRHTFMSVLKFKISPRKKSMEKPIPNVNLCETC